MVQSHRRRIEIVGRDGHMGVSGETARLHHHTEQVDLRKKRNKANQVVHHKAQLVVKGYAQRPGHEFTETYSRSPSGDLTSMSSSSAC